MNDKSRVKTEHTQSYKPGQSVNIYLIDKENLGHSHNQRIG
jgi:hypothetical protein